MNECKERNYRDLSLLKNEVVVGVTVTVSGEREKNCAAAPELEIFSRIPCPSFFPLNSTLDFS